MVKQTIKNCFLLIFFSHQTLGGLIVDLPDGQIQGYQRFSPANRSFYAYQGIPFAKPPIGELRFQPPVPSDGWSGVLDATKEKGICYQADVDYPEETEDCLYVNVFTPVLNVEQNTTKLPVIFWIYGGGFAHGAARYRSMGPDFLLEQDVVVVNFNYRVGPFGFLSTGDEVIPGNMGLKDQVLALKWTKRNIALFGGDPDKITLMGQSAGSASVGYHIVSQQSSGLFRGAIGGSGSPLNFFAFLTKEESKSYAIDLASKVANTNFQSDSNAIKQYLMSASAEDIDRVCKNTTIKYPLPTLEDVYDDVFLTEHPYTLLESGNFNRVPLLMGTNSEEAIAQADRMEYLEKMATTVAQNPQKLIPKNFPLKNESEAVELGQQISDLYLKSLPENRKTVGILRYNSDNYFSRGVIRHAQMQSAFTDVYFYYFSYTGVMGNNQYHMDGAEQCAHGEELRYYAKFTLSNYNNSDLSQFPTADVLTHYRMVKIITDFVKYLTPVPQPSEILQSITWPKVTPTRYSYVNINTNLEVKENPKGDVYLTWKKLYDTYGNPPFITY